MCLGVPGQVKLVYDRDGLRMAKVDFGGVVKEVCLEHTPAAQLDDFVIVHVGFALSVVDADEAQKVFQFLDQIGELQELSSAEAASNEARQL